MRTLFNKVVRHRYFILFILGFAYIQTIEKRISSNRIVDFYTFTPEAAIFRLFEIAILYFIISFCIKEWQKPFELSAKKFLKIFAFSSILYVFVMQFISFLIAWGFDKIWINFNQQTFVITSLDFLLNSMIYGSFFLVYVYYYKNKQYQKNLSNYNRLLAESKINQLKSQLNPHFLFNNLNVLDQLIEEDSQKASTFLQEFSEIYRYVLQNTDKELVDIPSELAFAQRYFKLIQYKYDLYYQLNIEAEHTVGKIVPMCLQLLIENAVQHNLGTNENPIVITITISKNAIHVQNNINIKKVYKSTSGRALKNLVEQYHLLSEQPIHIQQSDYLFSVLIPIIQNKPND